MRFVFKYFAAKRRISLTVMFFTMIFSIGEMAAAQPHTGGAYSFSRAAMGPWGGFLTGLAENVEYVLTPAVIVFFISSYMTGIFETPAAFQPFWLISLSMPSFAFAVSNARALLFIRKLFVVARSSSV